MSREDVSTFSQQQLYDFALANLGLAIADVLKKNAMTGQQFLDLDETEVLRLFPAMGLRKRVKKMIASCNSKGMVLSVSGRPLSPVQLDQSSPPYTNRPGSPPPIEQLKIVPPSPREIALRQYSERLFKMCKKVREGPPAVIKLRTEHWKKNEKHKIASCIVGERTSDLISSLHKVIFIVGATGSGKSTTINALANYMLGVTFSDPHRCELISQADEGSRSQAHSQTSWVTAYTFPKQPGSRIPYALTIVDTPGYGDTRGMNHDESITEQIKYFLNCKEIGVDCINAIAFVVKASDTRLTPSQKYIFKSILALFAKDTAPGMMIVASHADGKHIAAKEALKDVGVPLQDKLIFSVNNVALYAQNVANPGTHSSRALLDKITWNRTEKMFANMYAAVGEMASISLWQTMENLRERDNFRAMLDSIGPQIQEGIANARSIIEISKVIERCRSDIDANKDFSIQATILVTKQVAVPLFGYERAFNCKACKMTCHYPCITVSNRTCEVISFWRNKCQICPGECKAADHSSDAYRYETKVVQEKQVLTEKQLVKKFNYCIAEVGMLRSQAIRKGLFEKQLVILVKNLLLLRKAKHCLQRIQKISLNPNAAVEGDYIDMMIKYEETDLEAGWEERIASLHRLKEVSRLTSTIDKLDETNPAEVLENLGMNPFDLLAKESD